MCDPVGRTPHRDLLRSALGLASAPAPTAHPTAHRRAHPTAHQMHFAVSRHRLDPSRTAPAMLHSFEQNNNGTDHEQFVATSATARARSSTASPLQFESQPARACRFICVVSCFHCVFRSVSFPALRCAKACIFTGRFQLQPTAGRRAKVVVSHRRTEGGLRRSLHRNARGAVAAVPAVSAGRCVVVFDWSRCGRDRRGGQTGQGGAGVRPCP